MDWKALEAKDQGQPDLAPRVCKKWATNGHLISQGHLDRAAAQAYYGFSADVKSPSPPRIQARTQAEDFFLADVLERDQAGTVLPEPCDGHVTVGGGGHNAAAHLRKVAGRRSCPSSCSRCQSRCFLFHFLDTEHIVLAACLAKRTSFNLLPPWTYPNWFIFSN